MFSSPEELLETEWDESIRLVYADVRMRGISGIELCAQLRKRGHTAVKIIALTAQVLPEEKELFLQSGFDGIVLKPFKSQEFYAPIREIAKKETEFDFSALREMISDEKDFQEIKLQFVSDSRTDLAAMRIALEEENPQELLLLVHRLAGRFGQMGSKKLAPRLRELEIQLKNTGKGIVFYEVKEIIPELEKAIETV